MAYAHNDLFPAVLTSPEWVIQTSVLGARCQVLNAILHRMIMHIRVHHTQGALKELNIRSMRFQTSLEPVVPCMHFVNVQVICDSNGVFNHFDHITFLGDVYRFFVVI